MACILGGTALVVIKIGGYSHYGFFNFFTEIVFGIPFNFKIESGKIGEVN